jgi:thiazole/oxazole-forming peptide maturase SagC family component
MASQQDERITAGITSEPLSQKLRAVPVQIIEVSDGIVVRRGCVELKIGGERAEEVLRTILNEISTKGATREEICDIFAASDRPAVTYLLDELQKRRMLATIDDAVSTDKAPETELDVFYWHFGEQTKQLTKRLNNQRIVIVGVNSISRQLAISLAISGIENFQVIDYAMLRTQEDGFVNEKWPAFLKPPMDYERWKNDFKPGTLDLLVATSDFGGLRLMRGWNEFCVKNKLKFMSVVLQNLVGYIGPLVIPFETACFECFMSRRDANTEHPDTAHIVEELAFEGRKVTGYHPVMASILGNIAAFELIKFHAGWARMWNVATLIEVNMLADRMKTHKILKVPRCVVCSSLNERAPTDLEGDSLP